MRGRPLDWIEDRLDEIDDDALLIAAAALAGVAALVALVALGAAAGAVLWIGRPWSLIAVPVVSIALAVWWGDGDPED